MIPGLRLAASPWTGIPERAEIPYICIRNKPS